MLTLPQSLGGIKTYNAAGDVIMRSTNDLIEMFVSVHIDASLVIDDTLTVHANSVFDGDVSIGDLILFDAGAGSLTLGGDLDANTHSITGGVFKTVGLGMVLDGDSISSAGGGSITFDDDQMTFAGSTAYVFAGAIVAQSVTAVDGFVMSSPPAVTGTLTDLASVITKLNLLGNTIEGIGLISYT